jgi:hypothetical protein
LSLLLCEHLLVSIVVDPLALPHLTPLLRTFSLRNAFQWLGDRDSSHACRYICLASLYFP